MGGTNKYCSNNRVKLASNSLEECLIKQKLKMECSIFSLTPPPPAEDEKMGNLF